MSGNDGDEKDYPGYIHEGNEWLEYWYNGECVILSCYFDTADESIEIMEYAIDQYHEYERYYHDEDSTIMLGEYQYEYDDEGDIIDEVFDSYHLH